MWRDGTYIRNTWAMLYMGHYCYELPYITYKIYTLTGVYDTHGSVNLCSVVYVSILLLYTLKKCETII